MMISGSRPASGRRAGLVPFGVRLLCAQPLERAPDVGVGEHDRRLALQGIKVAAGESVSVFGRGQQLLDLIDERDGDGNRRAALALDGFVDADDEPGEPVQPREPGIADDELQQVSDRRDAPAIQLVGHSGIVEQHLVQVKEPDAQIDELDSNVLGQLGLEIAVDQGTSGAGARPSLRRRVRFSRSVTMWSEPSASRGHSDRGRSQ